MHSQLGIFKLDLYAQSGGFGGWVIATISNEGSIEHTLGMVLLLLGVVNGCFMLWRNIRGRIKKD